MLATVTTMARWANDVMNAIDANDGGEPWGMATTLEFPKLTLYMLITTHTYVTPGSSVTNIIHYATERSQVAVRRPKALAAAPKGCPAGHAPKGPNGSLSLIFLYFAVCVVLVSV